MPAHAPPFDLAIIGGGINGCAIARDASGRGLKVFLAERDDLASGTSQASSKLIHGGLRYLEQREFRLVREALIEREILLASAPHIIWPLRFVLPHHEGLRPRALLRMGLFLYDHMGKRKALPATRSVDLRQDVTGEPLKDIYEHGFEYSDCWVEDSRFTVLAARDAANRGAEIRTRAPVARCRRAGNMWIVTLESGEEISARALVNASGPWVSHVLGTVIGMEHPDAVRLVKGSHIVVDRLYDHDRCYIFQNADGRVCFTMPYEQNFTLIGTTDMDWQGDPAHPVISEAETAYLLGAVSEYFKFPVTADKVRWSYAGIRPLYDDGASKAQETTRDYVLKLDQGVSAENPEKGAPLLSVFGGKITTSRKLAEAAMEELKPFFPAMGKPWTASAHLPGGDFPVADVAVRVVDLQRRYSFLSPRTALRLFRAYGTACETLLSGARFIQDMGEIFGSLSTREIDYLKTHEWAQTADDILWRRSKLGLHLDAPTRARVARFMAGEAATAVSGQASASPHNPAVKKTSAKKLAPKKLTAQKSASPAKSRVPKKTHSPKPAKRAPPNRKDFP